MNAEKQTARLAGLLYLIVAITSGFGFFSLHGKLVVPADAAATAHNILASEALFRLGFLSSLICQTCFIADSERRQSPESVQPRAAECFNDALFGHAQVRRSRCSNILGPLASSAGHPRLSVEGLASNLRNSIDCRVF